MKKKFKLLLVLVIAVLTLSMVGYAAWYITRDPKSVDGNVNAYPVNSDEITVVLCNSDGSTPATNTSIIFGRPSTASNAGHWLQFGESDDPENLVVYFKVTTTSTISSTYVVDAGLSTSTSLFTAPTFAVVRGNGSLSGNTPGSILTISTAGDVVISATYAWGLGENPFTYFADANRDKSDELSSTDLTKANSVLGTAWVAGDHKTYKDFAKKYLEDLDTTCDGLTFEITVTDNHA